MLQSFAPDSSETATAFLDSTFVPKLGYGDPQYQGTLGGLRDWGAYGIDWVSERVLGIDLLSTAQYWTPSFTNAGNYGVGVFFNAAGQSDETALRVFGGVNQ
jgi:hypothetical protein